MTELPNTPETAQPLGFEVHVDQNEYLPAGGRVMDAVVSVTLSGASLEPPVEPGAGPRVAQVIMIDCSGSMAGSKIVQAKLAVAAAVESLRDGVAFAVVEGTETARMVYPSVREFAVASAATRRAATEAVRGLRADGGTAIGSWLLLAAELFAGAPARIRHGLLLTDGRNEHQTTAQFEDALHRCEGEFSCDGRGVGTGWEAEPLDRIADVLLGSAKGLIEPAALAAEFRAVTETLMGKSAADVSLRLWTPAHARLRFLKQVFPRISDLTGRGIEVTPRVRAYPTGNWGAETRDFHLSIEVEAGKVGEALVAARVRMAAGGQESAEQRVRVQWTEDPRLSTQISPQVAHFTGQAEMADLLRDGLAAKAAGDLPRATARLGRARELAEEHGNTEALQHLDQLVELDRGTVKVRSDMAAVIEEMAKLESKRTIRVKKSTGGEDADLS
ncbi:VWA domain-containing protein [Amycolatopsis nigrescens]|uniref:VWA domain-containing protein n=1 Tax=Amycolatopsis nigrescens TaxID=381445 RepID=UPI000380FE07|nr:vWA domain-containing protein [Amycolatopsis nigrescens]